MSTKTIVIGLILFSIIFVGGSYLLLAGGNKPEVKIASYSSKEKDRPIAKVEKTLVDLGKMKVSDEKSTEFTIKNTGTKSLQVYGMNSSCNCTFGQFIYQGKTSEEFGMHSPSDYLGDIAPNTEAKIRVIYRPSIMPVYGPVEREVYLSTNDPDKQKLVFQIKTVVQ